MNGPGKRTLLGVSTLAIALCVGQVSAQTPRYSESWKNPPGQSGSQSQSADKTAMERMLKELDRLVNEAERARAADPRFISDLRNLARRYAWPWNRRIAFDDFSDGNIGTAPAWRIVSGEFYVDARSGLRTRYVAAPARPKQSQTEPQRKQDVGRAIFGAILKDLANPRQQQQQQATAAAPKSTGPHQIALPVRISNVFALQVRFSSTMTGDARIEFGVGQGARALGYRIAVNSGKAPSLELLRVGSRGSAVIDTVALRSGLDDGRMHKLLLTRDRTGQLVVSIDDRQAFGVIDRGFRDAFDSFVLVNKGGDYRIRSVTIDGG